MWMPTRHSVHKSDQMRRPRGENPHLAVEPHGTIHRVDIVC